MSVNKADRTGHFLQGKLETFKLDQIIEDLKKESEYTEKGHNALTLFKDPSLSMVVICIGKDQKLHEHHAPGPFTLNLLRGRIRFIVEPQGENIVNEVEQGQLIVLSEPRLHEVTALEDSAFLLTIVKSLANQ